MNAALKSLRFAPIIGPLSCVSRVVNAAPESNLAEEDRMTGVNDWLIEETISESKFNGASPVGVLWTADVEAAPDVARKVNCGDIGVCFNGCNIEEEVRLDPAYVQQVGINGKIK